MNKTPSHTGSTLRFKILAIYIIFGFLAIFTTSILVSGYTLDKLTDYTSNYCYVYFMYISIVSERTKYTDHVTLTKST